MNRLSLEKRTQIIGLLVEGNSLRATTRLTGVSINTVTKLLVDVGNACQQYHDEYVREVQSKRVECDEIWAFCYTKDKNLPEKYRGQYGMVGNRDAEYAKVFMQDVADRLKNRVQLTTDGLKAYLEAVEEAFGADIDFAQLVKIYGKSLEGEHRYSPAECTGTVKTPIMGNPKIKDVSTSYVERQNLTMRMGIRRFTRLTNAFSKKVENHAHAVALHFMYYNYVRIHKSLRVTPAMAAGLTTKLWSIEDLARLLETPN